MSTATTRRTALISITTPTGPRSRTDASRHRTAHGRTLTGSAVALICALSLTVLPTAVPALDLFTFWSDEGIDLDVAEGDWVLYRMVSLDAGRRTEDLLRIRCESADDKGWRLAVIPVVQDGDVFLDVEDGSWSFTLDRGAEADRGALVDHVRDVVRMENGKRRSISDREWRDDPLLKTSLGDGFTPDLREDTGATTRVVAGRDLLCRGLNLASGDTTRIELPRGLLTQLHMREVSVTLHHDVPLLGVVYASERAETRSELDPPGRRRQPPPRIRIETMELIDYRAPNSAPGGGG